jgi:pantetheine-phosphate adenylyltransferase
MKVCLGGTFNILHDGHKRLFDKALELAGNDGSLHVGLVVGDIIRFKSNVNSLEYRRKVVLKYISSKNKNGILVEVLPISTSFGVAVDQDYDIIVVSPETKSNAEGINKKRSDLGKKLLDIIVVPFVLAEDGKPISSSRIIKKEINSEGKVL